MPDANEVVGERYALDSVIARGGMATVWRGRDDVLGRVVAIKVLHAHLAEDEAFLLRFRREALAAAGLTHPHVVAIYDTGEEPVSGSVWHYIVMEHCGGGTLGSLLREEGPLPTQRVAAIGATICDALDYAHSRSIVHRDIKPANVLIGDDGLLKVADFGIAKAAADGSDITTTGEIMGTVSYMSPEYAAGGELDARSDVYSLGVVLYELAVGRPPFAEDTSIATAMKHVHDDPPAPRSLRAGIGRDLEGAIMRALHKDPARRFESAAAMKHTLDAIADGAATVVAPVTPPGAGRGEAAAATSFLSESRWLYPVVALVALAIVAAVAVAALFDDSGGRGGNGGSGNENGGAIEVVDVTDFDPHGSEGEHPHQVGNAIDGDPATVWTTQRYNDSLSLIGKPGVGLLFDLGDEHEVGRVEIVTPDQDLRIELWAGNEAPARETDLERVGEATVDRSAAFEPDGSARYWLVWITGLPGGGGGTASIAEVRFVGR